MLANIFIYKYIYFAHLSLLLQKRNLRATETGGRNWCKIHLSTMLPSLNNRFCKPRVIFVGLEIGNTSKTVVFVSIVVICQGKLWRREWKRDLANAGAEDEGKAAKKRKTDKKERERNCRRKDGQRKDRERVAQWDVYYCPRCGPLAGYIRAHPPFGGHAIKWTVCELARCKRARGKRSPSPSPYQVTAPDTDVRGACATVAKLSDVPHRNFGYHWGEG